MWPLGFILLWYSSCVVQHLSVSTALHSAAYIKLYSGLLNGANDGPIILALSFNDVADCITWRMWRSQRTISVHKWDPGSSRVLAAECLDSVCWPCVSICPHEQYSSYAHGWLDYGWWHIHGNPKAFWHLQSSHFNTLQYEANILFARSRSCIRPSDSPLPVADIGGAGDGARCGTRASHPAEALEEEPRRAQFQTGSEIARSSPHHVGWAAQAPGPAAEPHHSTWGASGHPKADEEQEEEEREEIPARCGDPQPLSSSKQHFTSTL